MPALIRSEATDPRSMTTDRQFAGDNRRFVVSFRLGRVSDAADDDFGGGSAHRTSNCHAMHQPFDKQSAIGIEHDFDHHRDFTGDTELVAEGVVQFADQARMGTKLGHAMLLTLRP